MNMTILHGKWRQARGTLKTKWAKLTDDDRRLLNGKIDQMVGLLEERYGYTRQGASKALAHYLEGHGRRRHRTVSTKMAWPLAISAVGLLGTFIAGRFVLTRALAHRRDVEQEAHADMGFQLE